MDTIATKTSFVSNFAQIAWVVKDITVAQTFFSEATGIANFNKAEIIRSEEFKSTNYILFFDTFKDIGVFTEVMGITEKDEKADVIGGMQRCNIRWRANN